MKDKKPKGMLPRTQMEALRILARRNDGLFPFPREVVEQIGCSEPAEGSEINQALKHAANATKEDVAALLKMLDEDPELLLEAGNVMTPGGLDCRRVTIYEFCLGAGDPELAAEVQKRFAMLPDPAKGEAERQRQYDLYKPHIDNMLKQKPYDFTELLNALKNASAEDVKALRNGDMTHASKLRDAIIKFRQDHAPKKLLQPGMHYNYVNLQTAFDLINEEKDALYKLSDNNNDKLDFFAILIIGFLQRRLPGYDRCVFAQGVFQMVERGKPCRRSLQYTFSPGHYMYMERSESDRSRPYHKQYVECVSSLEPTPFDEDSLEGLDDDSLEGLGFNFFAEGAKVNSIIVVQLGGTPLILAMMAGLKWKTFVEQKNRAYSACESGQPSMQPRRS